LFAAEVMTVVSVFVVISVSSVLSSFVNVGAKLLFLLIVEQVKHIHFKFGAQNLHLTSLR